MASGVEAEETVALYSIWNWDRNIWSIYSTPETVSVGDDPKAPKPSGVHVLGADPDTQVKTLPMGAKLIGHDHVARGEVRRLSVLPGLGDDSSGAGVGWGKYVVGFVLGAVVMHFAMRSE